MRTQAIQPTRSNSTAFNTHRSSVPDKAASFKSLYLQRPQTAFTTPVAHLGAPDTALRLPGTDQSSLNPSAMSHPAGGFIIVNPIND